MPKFLAQLVCGDPKSYVDFRMPELDSLALLAGVNKPFYNEEDVDLASPYLQVVMPDAETAQRICSRAVMIKAMYEVYGRGKTVEEAAADVRANSMERLRAYREKPHNWRYKVDSFGGSYCKEERDALFEQFNFLEFKALGKQEDPQQQPPPRHDFVLHMHIGVEKGDSKEHPKQVYFTRLVAKKDNFWAKYTLKKRSFLGPTSTSADLAFLMANQGLARPGSVMFDPFVGTGSLLVACAHFRAYCLGSDLDWKTLHGKLKKSGGKTLMDNFRQYELPRPDILCSDHSQNVLRRGVAWVDSIVCDPPYGVRAGARKCGQKNKKRIREISEEHRKTHIPPTMVYPVEDVMADLLDLSAQVLKLGGRLVYLLPTTEDFTMDELPTSPCLSLHCISEQKLRKGFSRRLITMVKTKDFTPDLLVPRRNKDEEPEPSYTNVQAKLIAQSKVAKEEREKKHLAKAAQRAAWAGASEAGQNSGAQVVASSDDLGKSPKSPEKKKQKGL